MPFIVLEGLDGAGKSTQIKKLQDFLTQSGKKWEYIHFPRFDTPIYGELVAKFLRGELGAVDQVNPYLIALIYAGDRMKAAPMIQRWINDGTVVIIDRYVVSNIAYQCAKLTEGKAELREWIENLEYNENKIPRPDVTLFLDVPFRFTEKSLTQVREGDDREYLKGKKDIHESSLELQRNVREVYLTQASSDSKMKIIECSSVDGGMLPPDEIFDKIKAHIKPLI